MCALSVLQLVLIKSHKRNSLSLSLSLTHTHTTHTHTQAHMQIITLQACASIQGTVSIPLTWFDTCINISSAGLIWVIFFLRVYLFLPHAPLPLQLPSSSQ